MHNSRHVLRFPTCPVLCTTVVHDTGHVPGAGTWPELCMLENASPYPAAVFPSCGGQTAHSERFPMTRSQLTPYDGANCAQVLKERSECAVHHPVRGAPCSRACSSLFPPQA